MALQRRVSNRILRIEIHGAQEGKALVAMIDEASDPQGNVTELLISAGYAAPAPVNSSGDQQPDQTTALPAPTKPHSKKCLKYIPQDLHSIKMPYRCNMQVKS